MTVAVLERSWSDPCLVPMVFRGAFLQLGSVLARTARAAVTSRSGGLIRLIRLQPRRIARSEICRDPRSPPPTLHFHFYAILVRESNRDRARFHTIFFFFVIILDCNFVCVSVCKLGVLYFAIPMDSYVFNFPILFHIVLYEVYVVPISISFQMVSIIYF